MLSIETKYQLLVFGFILIVLSGCVVKPENGSEAEQRYLSVVTTIYPLQYFAERIGGDRVEVSVLVKPGVDAHSVELTTSGMDSLSSADVIISNGMGMEPWLDRALKALGENVGASILETTAGIVALGANWEHEHENHEEENHDPHYWLDPINSVLQAELIADVFAALDQPGKPYYLANLAALTAELQQLDQEFRRGLAYCSHNKFVISHAAFGYLARRYDIEQIPISGLFHDTEPSAKHIAEIADIMIKHDLKYVLVEALRPDESFPKTVATEVGVDLLTVHPLASVQTTEVAEYGDYFGLMRANLSSLKLALECNG